MIVRPPAPLTAIAATPRKEPDNKFTFNPFPSTVSNNFYSLIILDACGEKNRMSKNVYDHRAAVVALLFVYISKNSINNNKTKMRHKTPHLFAEGLNSIPEK